MSEDKKRLYVGNLPYAVDDARLRELFADYGVTDAKVIADKFSGRSKGFGFVTVETDEMSDKAVKEMNGKDMEGRAIVVNVARPMRERTGGPNEG